MMISIAMATFNGAAYIDAQLRSFLEQHRIPDELVVTDDCSSDGTAERVRTFASIAPFPVTLVQNDRQLGLVENFGKALSLTRGDLVFLSDQDDVWLPNKIATIVQLVEKEPDRLCFMNDAIMADGELRPNGRTKLEQIRLMGYADTTFVMGCCVALRRSLIEVLLPIPEGMRAHDNWLVQMADEMAVMLRIDSPLQIYRRHGANLSVVAVNQLEPVQLPERTINALRAMARKPVEDSAFQFERVFLNAAVLRLEVRQADFVTLIGLPRYQSVLERIKWRANVLNQRERTRSLPRYRRLSAIWALSLSGGYRLSGGIPGLLKDFFMRRR